MTTAGCSWVSRFTTTVIGDSPNPRLPVIGETLRDCSGVGAVYDRAFP